MGNFRTVYRGYAIYLFGESPSCSCRAEPLTPDLPILAIPVSEGNASWGKALRKAKGKIDLLLTY
jgi:hypothetical protein